MGRSQRGRRSSLLLPQFVASEGRVCSSYQMDLVGFSAFTMSECMAEIRKSVKLQFLASKDFDQKKLEAAIKKQDPSVEEVTFWNPEYYEKTVDSVGGEHTLKLARNLVEPPPPKPEEPGKPEEDKKKPAKAPEKKEENKKEPVKKPAEAEKQDKDKDKVEDKGKEAEKKEKKP